LVRKGTITAEERHLAAKSCGTGKGVIGWQAGEIKGGEAWLCEHEVGLLHLARWGCHGHENLVTL